MRKIIIPIVIALALIPVSFYLYINFQNAKCLQGCDDGNMCTSDYCDMESNSQFFTCAHHQIGEGMSGCAGSDGVCTLRPCPGVCNAGETKCYKDAGYNFSISYPDDWQFVPDLTNGGVSLTPYFMSNLQTSGCSVTIDRLNGTFNFSKNVEILGSWTRHASSVIMKDEDRNLGGLRWHEWDFILVFGNSNYTYMRLVSGAGNILYSLACLTITDPKIPSTVGSFERYRPTFEGIISSFRFNG